MPPNPPEEFSSATVSAYTLGTETATITSSKRHLANPFNSTQPLTNMGTTTTNITEHNLTSTTDGPRIDTDFVIRGYQQKRTPTRKRSISKPSQDPHSLTLSPSTTTINSTLYNNKSFENLKTSHFDVSNLQSIDFSHPYKSNSLLGKLRQQYEAVEKEKVTSGLASRVLPSEKSGSTSINSLSDLVKFLLSSINIVSVKFIVLCLLWYASSAVTNNIGKQILNQFNYPVTLTWIQFGFVGFYCYVIGHLFGYTRLRSPTKNILRTTLPLSLFSITGHVLSSVATSIVPVSFVHTTKALSPLFTVFFYRFGFKVNYSYPVYISLIPLTIGVMLACSSSSTANFIGFLFALGSTVIFVAQNIFSKKLLFNQTHPGYERRKLDELNLSFYSSTVAFLLMTPLWLYYEGFHLIFWPGHHSLSSSASPSNGWIIAFYFWLNGSTHFAQNILALSILSITSPVTYSIASLVKRIFVITASIIWFGQKTTLVQGIGIVMTFGGLYMYNQAKRDVEKKERKAREMEETILPITRSESEIDLKKHTM